VSCWVGWGGLYGVGFGVKDVGWEKKWGMYVVVVGGLRRGRGRDGGDIATTEEPLIKCVSNIPVM
jgi:hypothetical protein